MGSDTVKIFCPKCQSVYQPPPIRSRSHSLDDIGSASIDGAAFGTTFPHLFLMTFHNLVPEGLSPDSKYIPRVFGFRVHKTAKSRNDNGGSTVAARSSKRSHSSPIAAIGTTNGLNSADVDAADANDLSARMSLDQNLKEDNSTTTPAVAAIENTNQTKSNKGSGSSKNSNTKRKGKNNSNSSNGDADGKVKRQKRGNMKT